MSDGEGGALRGGPDPAIGGGLAGPAVTMYAMRQGFLDFFDAEYHLVVRFMMRNGAGLCEAEDATQEAFTRGWQKVARDQWPEVTHPRAWIRTVALNHHRKQRRDVTADPPEAAEPGPGHAELTGQALDVVTALSLIDDETARTVMALDMLDHVRRHARPNRALSAMLAMADEDAPQAAQAESAVLSEQPVSSAGSDPADLISQRIRARDVISAVDRVFESLDSLKQTSQLIQLLGLACASIHSRAPGLAHTLARDLSIDLDPASASDLARDVRLILDRVFRHKSKVDRLPGFESARERARDLGRLLLHDLARGLARGRALDGVLDHALYDTLARAFDPDLSGNLILARDRAADRDRALAAREVVASGADLSGLPVSDVEVLVGVVWDRDTRWAPGAGSYPVAPQMSPGAAKHFDASLATVHQGLGIPAGKVNWAATPTHAHLNAPPAVGRHPVVLYSPGLGDPRTLGTTLTEDLASRGYVVVTIDHTYDASEVEFPGGRVEPFKLPLDGDVIATLKKVMSARVTDTRFVLDQLTEGRLGVTIDPGEIGMFGQSAGGFTALQTMHDDPRVKAAADLDGMVGFDQDDGGPGLSPLAEDGLKRPYLLMGSQASDHHTVRSWEALWSNSTGWRRDLHLRGSKHGSYTDLESVVPQLKGVLPADAAYEDTGWADPAKAVAAQRAYLTAFFDRWLRGRDNSLLDHPSPHHPEVTFVR